MSSTPSLPRQLQVQYSGALYHVISRGNQREDIFLDDVDRHDFIKTLAEACQQTDWWVPAFCAQELARPRDFLRAPGIVH